MLFLGESRGLRDMLVDDSGEAKSIESVPAYIYFEKKASQSLTYGLNCIGFYCGNEEIRVVSYWVSDLSSVRTSHFGDFSSRTACSVTRGLLTVLKTVTDFFSPTPHHIRNFIPYWNTQTFARRQSSCSGPPRHSAKKHHHRLSILQSW